MSAPTKKRADGSAIQPYTKVPLDIADTAAFRNLSPYGGHLLLHFILRYRGEARNGSIVLGQREAAALLNMARATVQKAFGELREKGFIVPEPGADRRKNNGMATRWTLTIFGVGSSPPGRDFDRWEPPKSGKKTSPGQANRTARQSTPDCETVHPGYVAVQVDHQIARFGRFSPPKPDRLLGQSYKSCPGSEDYSLTDRQEDDDGWCGAAAMPEPGGA